MDSSRPYRSPGTDRFLSLLSRPGNSTPASNGGAGGSGVELHEEEIFWTTSESTDSTLFSPHQTLSPRVSSSPGPGSIPSPHSSARRIADRSSGILVALEDDDGRGGGGALLQRKPSISASTSPSSSSHSTRSIPVIPKPKPEFVQSPLAGGKVFHQSAPVNVPMMRVPAKRGQEILAAVNDDGGEEDEEEMLPPHEIISRRSGASPMTTFSVLEGAGRTLKGRDLRRVRNAVWRKTGFLD